MQKSKAEAAANNTQKFLKGWKFVEKSKDGESRDALVLWRKIATGELVHYADHDEKTIWLEAAG